MCRYLMSGMAVVLLFTIACTRSGSGSQDRDDFQAGDVQPSSGNPHDVLYALYLPTDISLMLEGTGSGFNPGFTLPLDVVAMYENPGQLALLLGALGVDLSYCKLFERVDESARCYTHIELLAGKLDLPVAIFEKSAEDFERFLDKPDSITALIEQVYDEIDSSFKNRGQESLASLALLGGWLEAMYIGARIYREHENLEMGDRILQQKFALRSLAGLLANYQESLVVRRYMHLLDKLKGAYENVEIRYGREGFRMDPGERIIRASVFRIDAPPGTLDQICRLIIHAREELIAGPAA